MKLINSIIIARKSFWSNFMVFCNVYKKLKWFYSQSEAHLIQSMYFYLGHRREEYSKFLQTKSAKTDKKKVIFTDNHFIYVHTSIHPFLNLLRLYLINLYITRSVSVLFTQLEFLFFIHKSYNYQIVLFLSF